MATTIQMWKDFAQEQTLSSLQSVPVPWEPPTREQEGEPGADWPPPDGFPALHATHVAIAALILAFAAGVYATLTRLHKYAAP